MARGGTFTAVDLRWGGLPPGYPRDWLHFPIKARMSPLLYRRKMGKRAKVELRVMGKNGY
jgi:hypothetical protein